jgi:hypothetical protein
MGSERLKYLGNQMQETFRKTVQKVRTVVSICAAYVTHFFKNKPPVSNGAIH